jgi:PAS domain S-box-containing protein
VPEAEGGWYRVLFEQLSVGVARYERIDGSWKLAEFNRAFPPEAAHAVLDAIVHNTSLLKGSIRATGTDERIVILDDTRFQQAFYGNAAAMVIARQHDLCILDVNPRWLQLFEATREEVIGETSTALGLITEATARARVAQHQQFPDGFVVELPLRTRKGADITVLASAKPIDIEEGQCTLTTLIDITDRKQAEAAFGAAFNASPAGLILVHETSGVTVAANRRLLEMTGISHEDLVGKSMQRLTVLQPSREELLTEITRTGRLDGVEIELGRADGTGVWTLGSTERVVLNGAAHRLTAFTEITEHKRLESELRELNAALEGRVRDRTHELEEMNLELEAFTSSISHDLRAPLRAIHGFSSVLLDDHAHEVSKPAAHYLGRIKAGAERMSRLIEDLLAFARLGRTEIRRAEIDLDALLSSVVEELGSRERLDLRIGKLGTCIGDPALVRAVWTNLVDNAFKYTRDRAPAVIEIGCEDRAGERIYFIQDNGIGFDVRRADKLFGMFQRLDTARGIEGTGVGLANVRKIVEKHGGQITATAQVGLGARFEFTLG